MVLITVRSCFRGSYGPDFTSHLEYFLFLSSLRTFIALETLFWSTFVSNGPLPQSVERRANNGKVLCSRPNRSDFTFYLDYFLFLSSFHTFNA